jgi:hypothetical protein
MTQQMLQQMETIMPILLARVEEPCYGSVWDDFWPLPSEIIVRIVPNMSVIVSQEHGVVPQPSLKPSFEWKRRKATRVWPYSGDGAKAIPAAVGLVVPRTPIVSAAVAGPVPQHHIPGAVTPASSSGHISITVPHVLFMAEGSLYHLDEQNIFVYEKYNIYINIGKKNMKG